MKPTKMTIKPLKCCIFGCRRSTSRRPEHSEWICAEHWRAIPRPTRRRHLHLLKATRADPGQALICRVEAERAWMACVEAATQAAAGLA